MRLMADILYYTGMRLGEMLACNRPKGDVLVVSEQVQWDHSGNPFLTTPKTQGSKREIPIPSQLREEIKNYMKGKNEMYLFQPFPARHKFHKSWQAFIVSMARYMDPDYTQEKSLRDLRSEHLPLPITPHYLRHNYASLLYNADVDILTAKKYLGHSSISTTLGIYSHLSENKEVREKEKVLDLFAVNE
jgi:integrase